MESKTFKNIKPNSKETTYFEDTVFSGIGKNKYNPKMHDIAEILNASYVDEARFYLDELKVFSNVDLSNPDRSSGITRKDMKNINEFIEILKKKLRSNKDVFEIVVSAFDSASIIKKYKNAVKITILKKNIRILNTQIIRNETPNEDFKSILIKSILKFLSKRHTKAGLKFNNCVNGETCTLHPEALHILYGPEKKKINYYFRVGQARNNSGLNEYLVNPKLVEDVNFPVMKNESQKSKYSKQELEEILDSLYKTKYKLQRGEHKSEDLENIKAQIKEYKEQYRLHRGGRRKTRRKTHTIRRKTRKRTRRKSRKRTKKRTVRRKTRRKSRKSRKSRKRSRKKSRRKRSVRRKSRKSKRRSRKR